MITLPREGLDHPVFSAVALHDFLELRVRWAAPLDPARLERIVRLLETFVAAHDWSAWGSKKGWFGLRRPSPSTFAPAVTPTSALVILAGVTSAAPLRALADAFGQIAPPLEMTFVLRERDDDGKPGAAREDPRVEAEEDADDMDDFWARSFDHTRSPPPTEDPEGLFSLIKAEEGIVTERRIMPFFTPSFRVAYGLVDVDDEPATPRAREVAQCLERCLARTFEVQPPTFVDREATRGAVTPISHDDRHGYSFAIEREEMLASYADGFRYREHELLYAVTDACVELGLARVVHWDRDEVYILNVWERTRFR